MTNIKIVKNLTLVATSTAARLIGTLVLFSLVSRAFGPEIFGKFAYWYTVGIVIAALSDYGFSQQILTKLSSALGDGLKNETELLTASKLTLLIALVLAGILFSTLTTGEATEILWILLILLASATASIFDFFGVILKSKSAYSKEATLTIFGTFIGNISAGLVGILTLNLTVACSCLLIFRVLSLAVQTTSVIKITGLSLRKLPLIKFKELRIYLKNGAFFATDNLFLQLFLNIDIFIAKLILTSQDTGLYLAGSRLFQASLSGIPILASVFIPGLARERIEPTNVNYSILLVISCLGTAIICVITFIAGQYLVPQLIYGHQFSDLSSAMPYFGIAAAIRYFALAPGIHLSVNNHQKLRIWTNATAIMAAVIYVATSFFSENKDISIDEIGRILVAISTIQLVGNLLANKVTSGNFLK